MPILHVHVLSGWPAGKKTSLLKGATQAVVDSLDAPLRSVRIMLHEIAPEHIIVGGEVGRQSVVFHVHMIAGRTEAQKNALYQALNAAACETLGVSGDEVRVLVDDVPNTDMGMANGVSAKASGR
ncbi:tautomerase family protein [Bordetella bronchialis]|uniref:4-oxalocrotonate tautomerase n=1 Tax=Bordetella bronchialis TaxID=463025 RepID=A0A193FGP0_9BORD|nr:tautomerase family protein [Bordetella bronchialis]ANN66294.1 4-oxalocrotonate tautomerase [Bordetella bronchialis]ANN71374.1 4-oxalocrotonate tautomerase [Bordetella bronchialis]